MGDFRPSWACQTSCPPRRSVGSSQAPTALRRGHTWTPPVCKASCVFGKQDEVADIHPAFRSSERFGPDGMRWLAPQQLCELEALSPRQVWSATVLPVLPSTFDCQSNLPEIQFLPSPRCRDQATILSQLPRCRARKLGQRREASTPPARSCWLPPRRQRSNDVG